MRDRWITDWEPSERWPHYTRANAGEVLPDPASPLGATFTWEHGMVLGWRDGYVRNGPYAFDEFDPERPETIGSFGGYMYINLSNVRMQGVRNPNITVEQLDLAFFGDHPDVPPYVEHPLDDRPDLLPGILEVQAWVMSQDGWPELDEQGHEVEALRASRPDLSNTSAADLLARARQTQPMLVKGFERHVMTSSNSGVAPGILFAISQAIGDPTMPMRVIAGVGDVDSAAPGFALWDLSRMVNASATLTAAFDEGVSSLRARLDAAGGDASAFVDEFERFLHEFGSRGPSEWEMLKPSWETKPDMALTLIDRARFQRDEESPTARQAHLAAEREQTIADVRQKLNGNDELAGMFEAAVNASKMMAWRERTKTHLVRIINEGRVIFDELGRRAHEAGHLDEPSQVYMLLDSELEAWVQDPASMRTSLAERAAEYAELFDLEPPFIIRDGRVPPLGEWKRRSVAEVEPAGAGDVLQGVPGCPGVARGRARIVLDPTEPGDLGPGDILVAPLTDPAWTPLFLAVEGVVVNVGGQISHAIIVSRELGLPCAISVTDATLRIPDGAEIEVDGSTGAVRILSV
jgi:pyruvate,water dikinase